MENKRRQCLRKVATIRCAAAAERVRQAARITSLHVQLGSREENRSGAAPSQEDSAVKGSRQTGAARGGHVSRGERSERTGSDDARPLLETPASWPSRSRRLASRPRGPALEGTSDPVRAAGSPGGSRRAGGAGRGARQGTYRGAPSSRQPGWRRQAPPPSVRPQDSHKMEEGSRTPSRASLLVGRFLRRARFPSAPRPLALRALAHFSRRLVPSPAPRRPQPTAHAATGRTRSAAVGARGGRGRRAPAGATWTAPTSRRAARAEPSPAGQRSGSGARTSGERSERRSTEGRGRVRPARRAPAAAPLLRTRPWSTKSSGFAMPSCPAGRDR